MFGSWRDTAKELFKLVTGTKSCIRPLLLHSQYSLQIENKQDPAGPSGYKSPSLSFRGITDQNCRPWPDPIVTTCMSYLTTGSPGKERGTHKLPPTGRIWERSKGERRRQSICPTNLPESFSLESILAERCVCHQEGP